MDKLRRLFCALIAAATLVACGGDGAENPTVDPNEGNTPTAGKVDCPDCDPDGPSAFEQAGLESRFYKPGDEWLVAWRYLQRKDMERNLQFVGDLDRGEFTDAYLFRYRVLAVSDEEVGGTVRQVATIEITQADEAGAAQTGAAQDLLAAERLDRHEHRLVFQMDDLLRPVSETLYTRAYPNGRVVQSDIGTALHTGSSLFPRTIPRITVAQGLPTTVELPDELGDVAAAAQVNTKDGKFVRYDFPETNDQVIWRDGDVWPFFVSTNQGQGVLVASTLAQ